MKNKNYESALEIINKILEKIYNYGYGFEIEN